MIEASGSAEALRQTGAQDDRWYTKLAFALDLVVNVCRSCPRLRCVVRERAAKHCKPVVNVGKGGAVAVGS